MAEEINGTGENDIVLNTGVKNAEKTVKDLDKINKSIINVVKTARMAMNELRSGFKFTTGIDTKNIEKELKAVQKASKIKIQKESISVSEKNVALTEKIRDKNYVKAAATNKVLTAQLKDQVNSAAKLKSSFNDIGKNISNIVVKLVSFKAAINAIKKAANFIKKANKTYGTFIETLNLAEVSFKDNAQEVVSWSKEYADSLGLSYNQVLKFASSLKSLADSMGIANDVGAEMSTTLTTLIYNIASLRNLDFDKAYSKIESTIFSGQLRTARTIGVDISVASMQALVEELGYAEIEYKNLTEAQKVQLRTIKVLRDLGSQSAGDLERTLTSTSNRLRILETSWENLLTVIGNATNTVFSDLLAYVIGAVQGLSQFIQELHPLEQSTGFKDTADAIGDIEGNIEGVNEQLGLLQIDKFESLSGAGDKQNTISFDADVDKALTDYNNLNKTFENIDKRVQEVSQSFLELFRTIDTDALKELGQTLGETALTALPAIVTGLAKIIKNVTNLFSKLAEGNSLIPFLIGMGLIVAGIRTALLRPVFGLTLLGIGASITGLSRLVPAVKDKVESGEGLSSKIWESMGGGSLSKVNGIASPAKQTNQQSYSQPINIGLNINDRQFASAVYNAMDYTNQRYTGASLGGN